MIDIFFTILIISSFLILPLGGTGGIAFYSPGILTSIFLYSLSLFANIFKSSFIYSKKFILEFVISSVFLSYSVFLAYYQGESIIVYFSKSLFLVSTLFISKLINKRNSNIVLKSVFFIFIIDLFYRLIFEGQGNSFLYAYKRTLFFVDTNSIGLTLVPAVTLLIKSKPKRIFSIMGVFIILSTFSRTTYFGIVLFFSSFLKKGLRNLAYILSFSLTILFLFFPSIFLGFDGSLDTKVDIVNSFQYININVENIIFGFGRLGIEDIVLDGTTVGHTILGISSQYGLIYLILQFLTTILFIKKEYRDNFIFFWIFVGFISIYPITTLGLSIILFNSALEECKKN